MDEWQTISGYGVRHSTVLIPAHAFVFLNATLQCVKIRKMTQLVCTINDSLKQLVMFRTLDGLVAEGSTLSPNYCVGVSHVVHGGQTTATHVFVVVVVANL